MDGDYNGLRERLESEVRTRSRRGRALQQRAGYSFDATIDPLLAVLERARAAYFAKPRAERCRFDADGDADVRKLDGGLSSTPRGALVDAFGRAARARLSVPRTARQLRSALEPAPVEEAVR